MRKRYYVFLLGLIVWLLFLFLVGPYVLGGWFVALFYITALASPFLSLQFRCPYCGEAIVRPRLTLGAIEMRGWTQLPGRYCTHCGGDTDQT